MTAKAKLWLKFDGRWIAPGEVFEVPDDQAAGIAEYADLTGKPEEPKPAEPKSRTTRKKK